MKLIYTSALLATLAGCMTATDDMNDAAMMDADASRAITTEIEFRDIIVGKTMTWEGNSFQFNADGTLSGPWGGEGIRGQWTFEDGAACRTASIGTRVLDPDCQIFVIDGSNATVTRDRGEGNTFVYEIS